MNNKNKTSELVSILGQELKWNKARLICFSLMILALLASRTISLYKMAVVIDSQAQQTSRYRRLKRFFSGFSIDGIVIARLIFKWFSFSGKKLYLTIDRTNWFRGKAKINVFTLAIAYEGIAIPLFWQLLPKAGNASAKEHISLAERFISVFGSKDIIGVLGDREFASKAFFKWLNKEKIAFYIRIKEGSQVNIKGKKWVKAKKIFNHLNLKEKSIFMMRINLWDNTSVFLAGSRSERGELMIVATNQSPKNAIAIYLWRWEIESLFQSLKGRGFHFEETHITALDRLEKVMALLALTFCWAHKVGEWRAIQKPIPINRYKNSQRPQCSYFRYGLDLLQEVVFKGNLQVKKIWKSCLQLIMSTPTHTHMQVAL
ncbi:MAG TPA: IS4 family transposase [Gammaproteobacteria bacterium]|nr:IS4 family transposase [Gammaproteobacteria bacterium]